MSITYFLVMGEFVQPAFQFWGDDKFESHYSPIHLSNSLIVIGFLPDLMVSSTDLTTSSHTDSLTSLSSSSAISDIYDYINTFPSTLTSCEDARYKMQDAGQTCILYPAH